MSRRLRLRGGARLDLVQAARWYRRQRIGLEDELLDAVRSTLRKISAAPLSFPIGYGQRFRRALVDRFPYAVYFVDDPPDGKMVVAILHTSRDAGRILKRR